LEFFLCGRAIDPNDRAAWRPAQKVSFDERSNHQARCVVIQPPQPGRLRKRQLQTRHLDELISHAVYESVKVHAPRMSNTQAKSGNRPVRGESPMFSRASIVKALLDDRCGDAIQTTSRGFDGRRDSSVGRVPRCMMMVHREPADFYGTHL
jgi:hypothetical protein